MGEAIETTQSLYPGLLERNSNLLFMLKCRQFIEMVNGTDSEVRGAAMRSPRSRHGSGSNRSSPSMSPVHHTQSSKPSSAGTLSAGSSPSKIIPTKASHSAHTPSHSDNKSLQPISEADMNAANVVMNGGGPSDIHDSDIDMQDSSELISDERTISNGTANGTCSNGVLSADQECEMDTHTLFV